MAAVWCVLGRLDAAALRQS